MEIKSQENSQTLETALQDLQLKLLDLGVSFKASQHQCTNRRQALHIT